MKKQYVKRLLSLVIAIVMCLGLALPAGAVTADDASGIIIEKVDNSAVSVKPNALKELTDTVKNPPLYADTEIVRVSIVLSERSTLEMAAMSGISTEDIANNAAAMSYREQLAQTQAVMAGKISTQALGGEELDVVWNLTLAANIISANVKYGQIEAIAAVPGVKSVFVETRYEPAVVTKGGDEPNMATSSAQIGSTTAYLEGYTGAGSRIAIIDTGTDIDHQSFDNGAFLYSLEQNAIAAGMTYEEYVASLDLLDAAEIAEVYSNLNISSIKGLSPAMLYGNEKLAFNFNYVDVSLNVTHDYDQQGEHGSHVAGIATANRYIPNGADGYVKALESVFVQGVAPDAQLITMKVFGADGGAYDSDYMAAIEDAIFLGADSINLSLGSTAPGMTMSADYQDVMDMLSETHSVVVMSAGNNGSWADETYYGVNGYPYLFADDVGFHTGGSPGTFTNSLGVASVDNSGWTAMYVEVNGQKIDYAESVGDYTNTYLSTLAGEQEFVFVNGIGTPEDFANVDVEGKIALCYRGTTSFFEKANAAVEAGAIGVIIVNNQPGVIYLNLTDYLYSAPVVSITQANGELFKGNPVTGEDGTVQYWTGTMNISETLGVGQSGNEYNTMSVFSSWGVPGDLSMKPEIAAPGGNIYSVFGSIPSISGYPANTATDQYELMSGTSMAAPQITGMMAVLMQYIRENDLSVDGLTDRALAQSLLMSTAVPMIDGNSGSYYPVLQQGAGLANIGAAIQANSYILMGTDATDSAADGKVKVELGDDPAKTGSYSFSFSINNMTDESQYYILGADFFTQDLYYDFLDTWTTDVAADITWLVNGVPMETNYVLDFNGDNQVDTADGQALLDYATGKITQLNNETYADLDIDGDIDSYDAYLFFNNVASDVVIVPANGSAAITVQVQLNDAKLANYVNGAYVEGYIFVDGLATAEGVEGESHSIPVLGFYGNWTDPSMYDTKDYLYQYTKGQTNMVTVKFDGDSGEYIFGGNPVMSDVTYMPERDALSSVNGSELSKLYFSAIRNAGDALFLISNAETGAIYAAESLGPVTSAYYNANSGTWQQVQLSLGLGFNGEGIPDGTRLAVSLVLAPELYASADGTYNWNNLLNTLGDGAWLSTVFTIDNTAPELVGDEVYTIDDDAKTMTVSTRDNQYVAGIALFDAYGQHLYTYQGSDPNAKAGDTTQYVLDLSEVNGAEFLLQVYDYANNITTYRITRTIGNVTDEISGVTLSQTSATLLKGNELQLIAEVNPINASNRNVTWVSTDPYVVSVDTNGLVTAVGAGSANVVAVSVADETKYASCRVDVMVADYTAGGVLMDVDGDPMSFIWNFSADNTWSKVADIDVYVGAAAAASNGNVYIISDDTNAPVEVNPVTGQTIAAGAAQSIPFWDFAVSKLFSGQGGTDLASYVYGYYFIPLQDPMAPQARAYNLGSALAQYTGASYLVAVESAGLYYDSEDGCYAELYYALDNAGYLWIFEYTVNDDFYLFNFYPTTLDVEFSMDYDFVYSNLVMADDGTLFLSHFNGNTNDIYMLAPVISNNRITGYKAVKVGDVGDGVWPAIVTSVTANTPAVADVDMSGMQANAQLQNVEIGTVEVSAIKSAPAGSLNAVTGYVDTAPVRPMSDTSVTEQANTVTLSVTAKDADGNDVTSTNGVVTVTYDAKNMTLVSVRVNGDYESVYYVGDNTVVIGYVSMNGIPAGDDVATLTFSVKEAADVDFDILHKETGAEKSGYEENIEVPLTPPEITAQSGDIRVFVDQTAQFSVTATGNDLTYQWQYRTSESANWQNSPAEGNNTAALTVPAVMWRDGYQYRCVVTDAYGRSVISNTMTLTVMKLEIHTQPADVTIREGGNAEFSVEVEGKGLNYQWQYRTSESANWQNSPAEGSNTDTLMVPAVMWRDGYQYRCVITDQYDNEVISNAATLDVMAVLKITSQPTDAAVLTGSSVTFEVVASGDGLSYQWQYRANANGSWYSNSVTTASITLDAAAWRNGYQYRCVITDKYGETVESNVVTLTVMNPLVITEQPQSVETTPDGAATFAVVASGDGLTYQWQYRANAGDSWKNNAFTAAAMTFDPVGLWRNGYEYRCVITDKYGNTVTSDVAALTVSVPTELKITEQPQNVTTTADGVATFTVVAQGDGLTYQWQFRANANGKWSDNAFTTDSMSFNPAAQWRNGYQYRCVITDKYGNSVTSEIVTLTIQAPAAVVIVDQPDSVTTTANGVATFTVVAEGDGLTYQWQYRASANGKWTNNAFTTSSMTFNPAAQWRNGYQYRCVVTDQYGNSVTSEIATLTIQAAAVVIVDQPDSVTTTANGVATFTVVAQGDGLTYQWQYRSGANGKWFDNAFTTSSMTFNPAAAWRNGYEYRCVVTDQYGNSVTSEIAILTVN